MHGRKLSFPPLNSFFFLLERPSVALLYCIRSIGTAQQGDEQED